LCQFMKFDFLIFSDIKKMESIQVDGKQEVKRRGRPRKYASEEERAEAKRETIRRWVAENPEWRKQLTRDYYQRRKEELQRYNRERYWILKKIKEGAAALDGEGAAAVERN